MPEARLKQWERVLDVPLTISTFVFLGAYAWPILDTDLDPTWRSLCELTVAVTWAMLVIDFVARLALAEDRRGFIRRHPDDVLVVALPLLRPLRLLRLVTLLTVLNRYAGSSLRGRVGLYLVASVTLIVFVASLAALDAERDAGGSITSFGDALWWAITTITTVGYGDTYPVTTTGRLIAVALMLAGIAVLGVVTASFASWLVERVSEADEEAEAATHADLAALRGDIRGLRAELALGRVEPPSDGPA